jgi:hypothetical protein
MTGKNENEQLDLIFKLCGTPTPTDWPDAESLPWYVASHLVQGAFLCPRKVLIIQIFLSPGQSPSSRGSLSRVECKKFSAASRRYVLRVPLKTASLT